MIDRANLGDILPDGAEDHPAVIDIRDPRAERVVDSGEMIRLSNAVARGLARDGFRRGDRIGILAENRFEFLAGYLGAMRAGIVPVPINWKLPRDTVEFIFADAGIRLVLTDRIRRHLVPGAMPVRDFDDGSFEALLDRGEFSPVAPEADEIAKILYTSGSTGRPKGVPLPHSGQLWALAKYFTGTEQGRRDRTIVVAPTYHKNGLFFSMMALSNQITIVSAPKFEPRDYLEAVARFRCTILTGIPTMFALIARERDLLESLDFSSVRLVTIGSAPLTDALLDRVETMFPGAVVTNGYGTTEAGPCAFGPHPDGLERPPLSLGYPFHDLDWRLVDGASPDEGVLHLRTPALMPGYLNLPDATAKKLRDGWYDTGDVMRHDRNGFFYFVGRSDDMFVCGGENIYPGEVEKLLERHPSVSQAAVVPVPDEIKGQIPVAFVVPVPGTSPAEDEIRQFALREGPAFAHPRAVVVVGAIPVAGTHKVDRRALIEEATRLIRARGRI